MNSEKDVIVFLEPFGENGDDINQGLLTEGNRIAGLLGGSLGAMIAGDPAGGSHILEDYGVSTLYRIEGERLSSAYSCEVFGWAAKEAIKDVPFRLLLFAHTDRGSELAPCIASYLNTTAVTACVDIRTKDRSLLYVRLVYGGQFEQEVSFSGPAFEVATIMPEVLDKKETGGSKPLRILDVAVEIPDDIISPTTLELIPPDYRTVDILYAKRIIGAGSGCGEPGLLGLVEELAHLLEGSVGTTRPMVDDGYLPKERMIGQTGKTVSPELYVALGISGSPHHTAGIQQSKTILSVNADPRAPIFNMSDTGFVCDLNALLPKLIDLIKRYRDEGLT